MLSNNEDLNLPTLHTETPLAYCAPLSASSGHNVFFKLETKQLSGSFKMRGIGRACSAAKQRLGDDVHLVVASGGNAALAAAASAKQLAVKCTVFVHNGTEPAIVERIKNDGGEVVFGGLGWDEVNQAAQDFVRDTGKAIYIHPFEGDDVVKGHTSLITEIFEQYPHVSKDAGLDLASSVVPDVIGCAVGGGGMIRGIFRGLSQEAEKSGHAPTHILAITPYGADAWTLSLESQEVDNISIEPRSRARSLATSQCSFPSINEGRIYATYGSILRDPSPSGPSHFPNTAAPLPPHPPMETALKYLTTTRFPDSLAGSVAWQHTKAFPSQGLIEIACGAALVPVYYPDILDRLSELKFGGRRLNIVLVACGGSRVSEEVLDDYKVEYGVASGEIQVDGHTIV